MESKWLGGGVGFNVRVDIGNSLAVEVFKLMHALVTLNEP